MPEPIGWMLLLFVALLITSMVFLLRYFLGVGIGAPYLPIHTKYVEEVMRELDIKPGTRVMDLGSGDGKILMCAAKFGAHVTGYELNPLLVWISRRRLKACGTRAIVHRKNLFEADVSSADIIFVFGITGIMEKLSKKLLREASPGTRIISFAFRLPGLEEVERKNIAFIYRLPQSRGDAGG